MVTKTDKIIYWGSTGLFSALALLSASMYFFNHQFVVEAFTRFGYPTYIIYPLGTAKILGLLAIWTKKSQFLKELAYAGFFFVGILAFFAHVMVGDPFSGYVHAIAFLVFVITSYVYDRKLFGNIYEKQTKEI